MHPADFVREKIEQQRTDELIELIRRFMEDINSYNTGDHSKAYSFVRLFLTSVSGQLRQLGPGYDLHDDSLLAVWAELGYFGIERDRLPADSQE